MTFILGWLFFSIAAAMFASIRRNRNGGAWFAVAIFFSPLVAFVLLFILHPLGPDDRQLNGERVGLAVALTILAIAGLFFIASLLPSSAQQQTPSQQIFRDAAGRTAATATTSGNQTTYRDANGRTIGTVTTGSSGQQGRK